VALFAVGATAGYLCHLAAFGVYMLGLMAFELARVDRATVVRHLLDSAPRLAMQAAPALAIHLLVYAPAGAGASAATGATGSGTDWSSLALYTVGQFLYAPALLVDAPAAITATIVVMTGMWVFWGFRRRYLTLSRAGCFIAAALFLAVLLLPPTGFGSALVDRRVLLPMALAAWASLQPAWGPTPVLARRWMIGGAAAGVVLLSGATFWSWSGQQPAEQALRTAMGEVEIGSKVAVLRVDGRQVDLGLRPHTASWSVIDRSVFLSSLYMKPFTPLALRCRPEFAPLAGLAQLGADNRAPTLASIQNGFDYAVVFGAPAATAAYAGSLQTLYLSSTARMIRLRQPAAALGSTQGAKSQ
jgi:hypothetical protein